MFAAPTPNGTTPVRVALAGAGFIATRGHLPVLKRFSEAQLVALVELNPERARAVAAQFSIPAVYSDYAAMLREQQPDLVILCTPNAFHAPMSIAALEAGSNVLCEKPMALTVADASAMVHAARATGRVLAIGLHNRFRPEMDFLKQHIEAGGLGNIYYAKASMLRRRGIPGFGSWFTNHDLAGGGALMDIGVHMVDLALWLMGNPRPISVTGMTYSEFGPRRRGLGTWGVDAPTANANLPADARCDVDDLAAGMVKFENGATLMLDVSWAGYSSGEERLQLLGTEGGAEVHRPDRTEATQTPLKLFSDLGSRPVESYPVMPHASQVESAHYYQMQNVLSAIRLGTPLRVQPAQAADVTAILCALQESAQVGHSVDVRQPMPA